MKLYQFGVITLPTGLTEWVDSPVADTRVVSTLGGHFNAYRGENAPVKLPRAITVNGILVATTRAAKGTAMDALRGMLGKRDRLWGQPDNTALVDRWCWATLKELSDRQGYKNVRYQEVQLVFEVESHWNGHAYGGAWSLDSGKLFDNGLYFDSSGAQNLDVAGTYVVNLPNAGNRLVTNCGITYTVGAYASNDIITLATQNCELQLLAANANDVYVIDCGSRTYTKNGAAGYAYVRRGPNHASPWDFEIASGGENVTLTTTDYDTVQFTYSDGYF